VSVLTPLWSAVPETAARLRGRIEAVLASAQVDGWIPEDKPNPARWRNWLERKLPKRQRLTRGHHAAMAYSDIAEFDRSSSSGCRNRRSTAALIETTPSSMASINC
jgi:hypothetical protein